MEQQNIDESIAKNRILYEEKDENTKDGDVKNGGYNEIITNLELASNLDLISSREEETLNSTITEKIEKENAILQDLLESESYSWKELCLSNNPKDTQIQVLWDKIIELKQVKRKLKAYFTMLDSEIEGYTPDELDPIFGKRGKIIICGLPGTGKSMLARAIGGILERHSYEVRVNRLSFSKNTQIERLKKLIGGIQENSSVTPSILILDNFQALGIQPMDLSREECTLNVALSELIDSISYTQDKLLLIAIVTDPEILAPQLWQKFDLQIELTLPDLRTRRHILRNLLSIGSSEINLSELAAQTEGFSYRDLQHLVWNAYVEKHADRSPTLEEKHLEIAKLGIHGVAKIQYKAKARRVTVGEALERVSRTTINQFDPYMIILNDPTLARNFLRLYDIIRENQGTIPKRSLNNTDKLFISVYKAFFTEKGGQIGLTANAESLFLALEAKKS
ncbi:MAG: AAA family ATPase [Promethearchaeota archaeon]